MPRPHPALAAGEAVLVLDDRPDLFVFQFPAESDHGGTRRTYLITQKNFPLRTMTPKSMLVKILRGRIQGCGNWTIAGTALTVTIDAGPLALVERFPFLQALGRTRNRAGEGLAPPSLSAGTRGCIMCCLQLSNERHPYTADEPSQVHKPFSPSLKGDAPSPALLRP